MRVPIQNCVSFNTNVSLSEGNLENWVPKPMFQWIWLLRRVLDKLNFGLSETRVHSRLDGESTFSPVGWLHNLVHDNLQEGQAMFPGWHG